ncbi:MAG: hypothetical protein HQL29_06640 [Candidatus Omnitrophica bacterium]|nr:hypothetical protein [Candidatus Omnitrophota bacterium]
MENIGPTVSPEEQKSLEKKLLSILHEGDHLLLVGSLPKGIADDYYSKWIEAAKKKGIKTYVDTRNVNALRSAIKAGPYFLGINLKELTSYLGVSLNELQDSYEKIAAYGESFVKQGIKKVVISNGYRGAVMSTEKGSWHAIPPKMKEISPVGAGDTIKIAFTYADINGMNDLEALRLSVAASALTVTKPGSEIAELEESKNMMDKVLIEPLETGNE